MTQTRHTHDPHTYTDTHTAQSPGIKGKVLFNHTILHDDLLIVLSWWLVWLLHIDEGGSHLQLHTTPTYPQTDIRNAAKDNPYSHTMHTIQLMHNCWHNVTIYTWQWTPVTGWCSYIKGVMNNFAIELRDRLLAVNNCITQLRIYLTQWYTASRDYYTNWQRKGHCWAQAPGRKPPSICGGWSQPMLGPPMHRLREVEKTRVSYQLPSNEVEDDPGRERSCPPLDSSVVASWSINRVLFVLLVMPRWRLEHTGTIIETSAHCTFLLFSIKAVL